MYVSMDVPKLQDAIPTAYYDVVVLGAGPYGLSAAAHLRANALRVAVFGKPLQLWRNNMPQGMLLRSYWWASNLSDPQKKYTMAHYFQLHHLQSTYPLSRETFIDYGLWFQQQAVPDVDETYITHIDQQHERFELILADGRTVYCQALLMAPGLQYYSSGVDEYAHVPPELMSHVSIHHRFDQFAGRRVVIIGGGQSALESAALLHENGANVTVISRRPICWLTEIQFDNRSLLRRLRSPRAGIAPGWFNWGLEHLPYAFQQLPRSTKDQLLLGRGRYGPAGASWLQPRILGKIDLYEQQAVEELKVSGEHLMVKLTNHALLHADHLLLATGYRVNLWKLSMLAPSLLSRIRTYYDAPILDSRFECSVPGLYFIGFSSVSSFGPFYRFVVGTEAAARRVTDAVTRQVASIK